uniref:Uncharacterized protein LOC111129597 n=1 Tax=Crassostrea virginica TaxID=6565 RepID=A0A8B8DVU4_CRAVI|nr:uncharacterized protein LOC111129597 [Crassostrea virginica]
MGSLESIQLAITELKSSSVKLDAEVKNVKNEFHQLEINVSSLGNVFDSVKDVVDTNKKEVEKIKKSVEQCSINQRATEAFASDLQKMKDASALMEESVIDLKARSMRDNLVFTGIPEERDEDTEALIQNLIQRKYKPDYQISFERVHRLGKPNDFSERPRNIVAKFSYFKDREYIRLNAARKLHGTRIWVNEQFPPEIENNRKKLYPVMRQAKKDRKRVKLVRDTLYIDGIKYNAPTESARPTPSYADQTARPAPHYSENAGRRENKRPRHGSTPDRHR